MQRRSLLRSVSAAALAACSASTKLLPSLADYGESAKQAPPAFLPSPFYPTGEMAKTCEVVALGREDVCLTPKKLLSAYEKMQHVTARH